MLSAAISGSQHGRIELTQLVTPFIAFLQAPPEANSVAATGSVHDGHHLVLVERAIDFNQSNVVAKPGPCPVVVGMGDDAPDFPPLLELFRPASLHGEIRLADMEPSWATTQCAAVRTQFGAMRLPVQFPVGVSI